MAHVMDYVLHLVQMVVSLVVKGVKVAARRHAQPLVEVVADRDAQVHVSQIVELCVHRLVNRVAATNVYIIVAITAYQLVQEVAAVVVAVIAVVTVQELAVEAVD